MAAQAGTQLFDSLPCREEKPDSVSIMVKIQKVDANAFYKRSESHTLVTRVKEEFSPTEATIP